MKKRNKSIIQPSMDRCIVCGSKFNLHTHEVFYGSSNREKSIEWGCYVKLCPYHHNASNEGVHYNRQRDLWLKKLGQRKFEELYGHEKFMEVFHKNYL